MRSELPAPSSSPEASATAAETSGVPVFTEASDTLAALLPELKVMANLVTAGVVIAALYFGRDILIPLALAFLLSFVLDPVVLRLKRWGLPRAPAVVLVVVVTLGLLGLGGLFLGSQVKTLSAELPTYQSNIRDKLRGLRESASGPGMLDGVTQTVATLQREVEATDTAAPAAGPSTVPAKPSATPPPQPRAGAVVAPQASAPQRVVIEEPPSSAFRQAAQWLDAGSGPLATAGIVLVFTVLALLDRLDLRDRLLRLWGGSLHRSTDAMDEAGTRISKYLTMQLVVNLSYGIPMAAGLWFIGVPGAILWGVVAAVMRFVPYIGPMVSAIAPVALAFAVDPGWSMVLWTVGLIVVLELLSNNLVEPWLYGASTGLSAMSLMVAATFWTALWGPVGLIMATPLTVCLLVIGRHLPRLAFLDVLLGSAPALAPPTRIYQRLIAGDVEEATELAREQLARPEVALAGFYGETGMQVLRMATSDHLSVATAEHRHRVVTGMEQILEALEELHPPTQGAGASRIACIGGKWEVDTLSMRMLAHAVGQDGLAATVLPAGSHVTADYLSKLALDGVDVVCLGYLSTDPAAHAQQFCRRLKRRWPRLKVLLGFWNAPSAVPQNAEAGALGADAVVGSLAEAAVRVAAWCGSATGDGFLAAPVPQNDDQRIAALRASGALDPRAKALFDESAQHAADIFDMPMALVNLVDAQTLTTAGHHGTLPPLATETASASDSDRFSAPQARAEALCGHVVGHHQSLVVPDLAKDARFAANPVVRAQRLRFYAGAPLQDANGQVLGSLCLLDTEPRTLTQREVKLLESMAQALMEELQQPSAPWRVDTPASATDDDTVSSGTIGQALPAV